jgi:hypothetical protein
MARAGGMSTTKLHDIEIEQALLGVILINNDALDRVSNFLEPKHFFEPIHQRFFAIASSLVRAGKVATPVTMKIFLPDDFNVAGLPVSRYLAFLAAEATTIIKAEDYGRIVYNLSVRREEDHSSAAMKISARLHPLFDSACCDLYAKIAHYCDSPIEVMLGTALIASINIGSLDRDDNSWFAYFCPDGEVSDNKRGWGIVPQLSWNGYRIDWGIYDSSKEQPWLFVECDGHEFHERTKEQAQRDREKDRVIQAAGIPILRFTGSEIFRNVHVCAFEIFQFIVGPR